MAMQTGVEEKNKELMTTLDEAWNAQDWDTFEKRHTSDTAVYWPGPARTDAREGGPQGRSHRVLQDLS